MIIRSIRRFAEGAGVAEHFVVPAPKPGIGGT
jgi:hypothetical protein